ncbi:hypothetical protein O3M35_011512 [Rhynocoris fuscipes]|uniref:Tudor domain-containing protein n=1 Tax=Rhynocoris fuscipes TaxID=488301 RepID=A0AAW1CYD4_9HEMI
MLSNGHSMTNILPLGTAHDVYVTYVSDGPYSFCVQPKNFREEILPKLSTSLRKNPPKKFDGPLHTGSLVLARTNPYTYRRSAILNSKQKCTKLEVYFFDFGFNGEVSDADIYEMPQEVSDFAPAQAKFFTLGYIRQANLPGNFRYRFKSLVLNKEVLLIVLQNEPGSVLPCCELFLDGKNVREILLVAEKPNSHKTVENYTNPCIPRCTRVSVNVDSFDSPSKFFIHYSSNVKVLETIGDELSKWCPNQNRIKDTSNLWLGKPVGTLFSADNLWYRAMISGILDKYTVNVFYIDYGNRETVKTEKLCDLNTKLITNWTIQAVECCLIGFENTICKSSITNHLEKIIINNFFTMEVHYLLDNRKLVVDLIDKEGNSIAVHLKKFSKKVFDKSDNSQPIQNNFVSSSIPSSHSSRKGSRYFTSEDRTRLKSQPIRGYSVEEDGDYTRRRERKYDNKRNGSNENERRIETSTYSNYDRNLPKDGQRSPTIISQSVSDNESFYSREIVSDKSKVHSTEIINEKTKSYNCKDFKNSQQYKNKVNNEKKGDLTINYNYRYNNST